MADGPQVGPVGDVTIGIPAHNAADTLGQTLASIAGQTIPPRAVVVVNDGSTDGTAAVAEEWSSRLPLEVVHGNNRGPGTAHRSAFEHAQTTYLCSLGADDVLLPNHVEELLRLAGERTIVSPNLIEWYPPDRFAGRSWQAQHPVPQPADQPMAILRSSFAAGVSLMPTTDYHAVGGHRADMQGAEDWDLFIRLLARGCRVVASPAVTYLYRRPLSPTASQRPAHFDSAVEMLERVLATTSDPAQASVLRQTLAQLRARQALAHATSAGESGQPAAARAAARGALGGPRPVAARALAYVLAPRLAAAMRARALRRR